MVPGSTVQISIQAALALIWQISGMPHADCATVTCAQQLQATNVHQLTDLNGHWASRLIGNIDAALKLKIHRAARRVQQTCSKLQIGA
ncbi:hypothetical protein F5Y18DRAFT_411576 [Xylariaceae sp. FL1019]|nr:hypothetical protein F5Y18DRAFT_411576 [Xylariaceae sp. FL1019]